jgi:NhaP-type Na+/H+ or K+/H+ antiporter
MIFILMLLILISRFINIYLCSHIANFSRTDNLIDPKKQFFLWFSGVRGAMAFALAIKSKADLPEAGPIFLALTLIIISFTLIYSTLFLDHTLKKCEIINLCEADNFEGSELRERSCFVRFKEKVENFSNRYLVPLVSRDNLEDNHTSTIQLKEVKPDGDEPESNNKIEIKKSCSPDSSMNAKNYYEKKNREDVTVDKRNFQIKNKHLFE